MIKALQMQGFFNAVKNESRRSILAINKLVLLRSQPDTVLYIAIQFRQKRLLHNYIKNTILL